MISYGERVIYNLVGFKEVSISDIVRKEATMDGTPDDPSHWGADLSKGFLGSLESIKDQIASVIRANFKFGVGIIDEYLYSLVLLGRYMWLVLLEITAPIAMLALFMSDDKNNYKETWKTWLRHMIQCHLLGAAFIIANLFAEIIQRIISNDYGYDNVFTILFILVIKIFLYAKSGQYVYRTI
ncbi:hypothetical protein [Tenacibaculum agarivorans]|uniref:hypothetical protein n=1 Tax=Tenacibaculum agarivorans TaxID=1908389 RepID=UPI00117D300C|nr:hypothetical protein [Tenacibaculum agarivorans]